jgi:hypothetical protein
MSRLLRRHRKLLTSTVLGLWAFAMFVGIANACNWDGVTAVSHHSTVAAHAADAADDGMAPDCDEFCSNDVPILSVVKLVQEPPTGQPLVLATHQYLGVLPISAPGLSLSRAAIHHRVCRSPFTSSA